MPKDITMRHPNLPPGQTVQVDERGARALGRSGWERVADEHPAAAEAPAAEQVTEPVTPRRRRTKQEE
jgi:hypothetical protein